MLYRTCPSWHLHVCLKWTLIGSHLVFTLEKIWQPVRWKVEEVSGGRVGVGWGGVQVMHLSFYFYDSLHVKDGEKNSP